MNPHPFIDAIYCNCIDKYVILLFHSELAYLHGSFILKNVKKSGFRYWIIRLSKFHNFFDYFIISNYFISENYLYFILDQLYQWNITKRILKRKYLNGSMLNLDLNSDSSVVSRIFLCNNWTHYPFLLFQVRLG